MSADAPIPVQEIEAYLERKAGDATFWRDVHEKRFGKNPGRDREVRMLRAVANSFHWISRDPSGFSEYCARLKKKFGPLDVGPYEPSDQLKADADEAERLMDGEGDPDVTAVVATFPGSKVQVLK